MREYQDLRTRYSDEDATHKFTYNDMQPVYTIVLLENSTSEFKSHPKDYIHKGHCHFDTGLSLEMLQYFIYIPLDIFVANTQNKSTIDNDLEAWLTLFGSYQENRLLALFDAYPEFWDIYQDVYKLRMEIEEAMHMFSEVLAELDRNTVEYMVDEMNKEIASLKNVKEVLASEKETLESEKETLEAEKETLESKNEALESENALLRQQLAEALKNKR